MLEVGFFGQPRFAVDGAPFRLAVPPKALLILAHLLLHRGSAVSRDSLSFTIWPDDDEDEARGKLRKYLYRLIRALPSGEACIRADGDTLAWNDAEALRLDVAEFEDALATGRYDDAIAVYAGNLLEGFYDDWILSLRERYRSDFFAALDTRLLSAHRARNLAEAQGYARRILAEDPWREDVVRTLMSLKYEAGDRAGALRAFDEFALRAREDMDVEPMSDTIALRDAIIRGTLRVRGDDDAGAHAPARSGFRLVGRDQELSLLRRAWQRSARGNGQTYVLSGEAGIGKTRLAQELALIAESEGARILWGAASPGTARPYQAIVEAIERHIGLFGDIVLEHPWLDSLATLIPSLRDVVGAEVPPSISPEREQRRLIDAIAGAVTAIAAARPTVLVLEDVQWASPATVLAVERVAGNAPSASLLVLLTHRDDESAATPFGHARSRLVADLRAQVVPLGRLAPDAVRELVSTAGGARITEKDASTIADLTAGNPLMILTSLQTGFGAGAAALSPRQILLHRFDGLPGGAVHFAEFAAVAGARFGFDLVREAVACPERDAFDAVNALQDARIIEERPGGGAFELRFTHELLRDALYERIDESVRSRRHGRIARVLERIYARDPRLAGEIAEHYERGDDAERAAFNFVRAADYAASVFAYAEARVLARRAIATAALEPALERRALWIEAESSWRLGEMTAVRDALARLESDAALDDRERCRILRMRSELEFAAGDRPARLRAVAELERIATEHGFRDWLASARVERVHSDLYAGVAGALDAARREAGYIDREYDPKTAVRLLAVLCTASTAELAGDDAATYAERARAIADSSGDPVLQSVALKAALGVAHQHQDFPRVRELAQRMIELAQGAGDSLLAASGYAYLANASYGLGDVAATREAYAEALARMERVGDRANLMRAALNCAVFECEEGFFDDSRRHALQAQSEARLATDRAIEHRAGLVLATIETECERYAAAREMLDGLLQESDVDPQTRTGVLEESGRTAIGEADYPRAIADLEAALRGFEALSQRWYARRARAYLALANALGGSMDRARQLGDALRSENADGQPLVFAKRVDRSLAQCQALLASAMIGDSSDRATA